MMELDALRAELERLFELEELMSLSRDVLGFPPDAVGGTANLVSFAGALVGHCAEADALAALADALVATKPEIDGKAVGQGGEPALPVDLKPGQKVGGYSIVRKLGEGRLAGVYAARLDDQDVRLRVLHPAATRDQRGVHRYLTLTRLIGRIEAPEFPRLIEAGVVDGHVIVAHALVEGQPLGVRLSRTGPMHINEARPILQSLLSALDALHRDGLVHGDVSLDNIVISSAGEGQLGASLLDAGSDRLRVPVDRNRTGLSSTSGSPRTVSPEQIRGIDATPRSDLYSLGAVAYELLSGKPPFEGDALEAAFGHLRVEPAPPSQFAPKGWVSPRIDEFVLRLLSKDPNRRPASARELLAMLDDLSRPSQAPITEEALASLEQALLAQPTDTDTAIQLESAIDSGVPAERIAQAFRRAAAMIDDPSALDDKKSLLFRAARLFERSDETLEGAESVYEELLIVDPQDAVASAGLEEVRRRAGKYEELIEMLLSRAENSDSGVERARAMGEIGRIYAKELDDREQAVVAYAQAFCENTAEENYAQEIERLAGKDEALWGEALSSVGEASQDTSLSEEVRTELLLRAGEWYRTHVARPDLALPCFQAVLHAEPSNERALAGMTEIYRRAHQWNELGGILTHRADAAATPNRARDLRAESAEVLEHQLGDVGGARGIYEQIVSEDPSHQKASDALARLYDKSGDFDALVRLLERRAEAQRGPDRVRTVCRIAEILDDRLDDPHRAIERYRSVLDTDAMSLDALQGLERVYSKLGKYGELVETLERQTQMAATPKQRIGLLERIAAVYEEEFLDHEKAIDALERALEADPGRLSVMAALARHYRVMERWEDVSNLYERQLSLVEAGSERVALAMAWGRVLSEQIGSPDRAAHAYELVLQVDPEHGGALEALAKLRETSGDADAALAAILTLAEQASSPEARGEQFVRAAKLLEARGDRDGAIEHYRNALDANPTDRAAAASLRAAYVARGDVNAAVNLIERELETVEGDRAKAKLAGEMARLLHDKLRDTERAERAAKHAIELDPGSQDALLVLGEIAFENKRFVEAGEYYGRLSERAESLGDQAVRLLVRYVDALAKSGSTEKALAAMDTLLRLAPDNMDAVERVALVTFEHGSPQRAAELLGDYIERFGDDLHEHERAIATYQLGESLRRAGKVASAIPHLEEACDIDPGYADPLRALGLAHEALENWDEVFRAKSRHLDLADGDERVELLLEIGDLAATKLEDRTLAAKNYVAALEERPDDRKVLGKLMQLYSEEKDWNKLVEVVLKLADFVDAPAQKVKYLHTAAMVTARQIGDVAAAAEYFDQVLELDPKNLKALGEITALQRNAGNFEAVEDLLKRRLQIAEEWGDTDAIVTVYDELGELYERSMGDVDRAVTAFEHAFEHAKDDKARLERLASLYEADAVAYRDKAVALQEQLLSEHPYRQDSYKKLRKIYTANRDADASWALCQALSVLQLAEPDEERFYNRMRAETAAPAQAAFSETDWLEHVMHPSLNPLLTAIFALIEPAVVRARAQAPESLGFSAEHRVDPATHEAPLAQTLYYAAGVLGVPLPAVYVNYNDPGGLSILHAHEPSLVLGQVGLSHEVPPQAAAFVAARQLAFYRPGLFLRHFVTTGTGLKSWLFAAIKLTSPQFPVAPDFEGPVNDALDALRSTLGADVKEHLNSVVSKLIQSGASLDLKKWVGAVDLTADRAGFIVAHDLDTVAQVIRATDDAAAAIPSQERFKEVVLYSVSQHYFEMRRRLGITVDT